MTRAHAALLAAVLAATVAPGCHAPTYVLVNVDGPGPAVGALAVTVTNGGPPEVLQVTAPDAAPITFPTAFVLRLRHPTAGAVDVSVSTVDPVVRVSSGSATGEVVVGDTSTLNVTLAEEPICGNDVIEGAEECDGSDVGPNDCVDRPGGFTGGMLGCATDCTFDVSGCYGCGNGTLESAEPCDGTLLGAADCTTIGMGFSGGTLACDVACAYDTTACYACLDGTMNPGEACDGADLGGQDCAAMGFDGGVLACDATCAFDTASCCAGTTACLQGGAAASAPCTAAPVATCVPDNWDYCACGDPAMPAVFLEPSDGSGPLTAVTVAGAFLAPVSLSLDGCCAGTTAVECDPADPCPATTLIDRWSSLGCTLGPCNLCTPGMHTVTIRQNDTGCPCTAAGGGSVLYSGSYMVP
jgi:hypothetical protein